ncbi:MAG: DUF4845 domain-containing protein [Betaproteobacteria bacterium]|nr:DUF4845 domain-containing protein [Betaproteobacteria bacterium]
MKPSIRRQRGIGVLSLLIGGGMLFFVSLLGMKVAPDVLGYFTVLKNVKATAHDPGNSGANVSQIRSAYRTRTQVEGGSSVTAEDLEITKEGNEIVISFAYSTKIPLFANVSLMIDFEGSSK